MIILWITETHLQEMDESQTMYNTNDYTLLTVSV